MPEKPAMSVDLIENWRLTAQQQNINRNFHACPIFKKLSKQLLEFTHWYFLGWFFWWLNENMFLNNYFDKLCHFNHFFKWCKCNELSIWYRFVKLVCGLPIWTTEQSGFILNNQQWCLRLIQSVLRNWSS